MNFNHHPVLLALLEFFFLTIINISNSVFFEINSFMFFAIKHFENFTESQFNIN